MRPTHLRRHDIAAAYIRLNALVTQPANAFARLNIIALDLPAYLVWSKGKA